MVDWSLNPGKAYRDIAIEYSRLAGMRDSLPIVKRKEHPEQWREWYAYYKFRKLGGSMELMRKGKEKTVPALSPRDFDPEFNPAYGCPEVPQE